MTAEENIKQDLIKKFGIADDAIRVARARRIFVELAQHDFEKVFAYAKEKMNFNHLVSITGFDEPQRLAFMYHLAQDSGIILNLRIGVEKENPVIRTVTGYFPGADIYERELVDLFGARVEGLTAGNRYPLTDEWPKGQHPLRKDWKPAAKKERAD